MISKIEVLDIKKSFFNKILISKMYQGWQYKFINQVITFLQTKELPPKKKISNVSKNKI